MFYNKLFLSSQNKLYMFGGVEGNDTSRDLWTYSVGAQTWSVQHYNSTVPMGVAGHTAHIVRGVMYVLFGYSPIYGYQNRIQEYNLGKLVPETRYPRAKKAKRCLSEARYVNSKQMPDNQ